MTNDRYETSVEFGEMYLQPLVLKLFSRFHVDGQRWSPTRIVGSVQLWGYIYTSVHVYVLGLSTDTTT